MQRIISRYVNEESIYHQGKDELRIKKRNEESNPSKVCLEDEGNGRKDLYSYFNILIIYSRIPPMSFLTTSCKITDNDKSFQVRGMNFICTIDIC